MPQGANHIMGGKFYNLKGEEDKEGTFDYEYQKNIYQPFVKR